MQMHATFWHLIHLLVAAVLCILWAPGELSAVFQIHQDAHRDPVSPNEREGSFRSILIGHEPNKRS